MKIIAFTTIILSVFLFGVGCTQKNSAKNISNVDIEMPKAPAYYWATPSVPFCTADTNTSKVADTNTSADEVEEVNKEPEIPKYKVEMLMDSEYYAEEVESKVGSHRGWLGLFRKKNKYFLMPTTIKVKAVSHALRDGKDSKKKTGREVSSNVKLPSVFLLRNAKMLHQGEVKTVFYGNETESEGIDRKYRRNFKFNGKKYTLFVKDTSGESSEYLTGKSKLIITDGKTEQVIFEPEFCSDCSWNVCWVGDLDGDGKLDFMLNLNEHYNSTCHTLFLSSQAKKGKIVSDVAEVCQMGC
ncbi:MAG: hypothetical protein ABI891_10720 [Acidobacteriota bacterium]